RSGGARGCGGCFGGARAACEGQRGGERGGEDRTDAHRGAPGRGGRGWSRQTGAAPSRSTPVAEIGRVRGRQRGRRQNSSKAWPRRDGQKRSRSVITTGGADVLGPHPSAVPFCADPFTGPWCVRITASARKCPTCETARKCPDFLDLRRACWDDRAVVGPRTHMSHWGAFAV